MTTDTTDSGDSRPVVTAPTQQALPGVYAAGSFRDVPGYRAQASECGVVLGAAGTPLRGSAKGRAGVHSNAGKYVQVALSRLVALAWLPNPQGLPNVLHKDGDITNNAVYNLVWADGGRRSKLGGVAIAAIRTRAAAGEHLGRLAEEFGTSPGYVKKLVGAKLRGKAAEAVLGW